MMSATKERNGAIEEMQMADVGEMRRGNYWAGLSGKPLSGVDTGTKS